MSLAQSAEIYSDCVFESLKAWLAEKGPRFYHLVASQWNWDEDIEILDWIVSQDDCDAGTAQAIFWLGEPEYFTEDERNPDGTFGINDIYYRLILKIARLWEDGAYKRWEYSEATSSDTLIRPIMGSRVFNSEFTVPIGLDEKRHGEAQTKPSSRTLPTDGVVFFEGIPESIADRCASLIGEDVDNEGDAINELLEHRSLLDRLSDKILK